MSGQNFDRYVLWLQQSLNKIMNRGLTEDGDFGGRTRIVLNEFRRLKRLSSKDDLVCPDTEQALVAAGAIPPPGMVQLSSETIPPQLTLYVDIPLQIRPVRAKSMTGIFMPDGFCPRPEIDLIVYLHGWKARSHKPWFSIDQYWKSLQFLLREEVNKSQKNVILVAPTLGPKNEPGSLLCSGGFDKFLTAVLEALKLHGPYKNQPSTPSIRNIILACHSGSGGVMQKIAHGSDAAATKIRECWAFEPSGLGDANKWQTWAQSGSQRKLFIYYIAKEAGEIFCQKLLKKQLPTTTQVSCSQNIFAEETPVCHDGVPAAHLSHRIQSAPFLLSRSGCAPASRSSLSPSFFKPKFFQSFQTEVSPMSTYVRDFSGPAAECTAALARAGKTKAEALAIINRQIGIAIALLRNTSASLTGTRTSTTKQIFHGIFRVNPEYVPEWLKVTPTIKDRGDVVARRCKRVADLLASGSIRYFCAITRTNCPACHTPGNVACSSWGNPRVICLGPPFWDAMKAGDTNTLLAVLMHEPFHIFYGQYVTAHVLNRGKFSGIYCIQQFVFQRNNRTPPDFVSERCGKVPVRREIGEFSFPTIGPEWDQRAPRRPFFHPTF